MLPRQLPVSKIALICPFSPSFLFRLILVHTLVRFLSLDLLSPLISSRVMLFSPLFIYVCIPRVVLTHIVNLISVIVIVF